MPHHVAEVSVHCSALLPFTLTFSLNLHCLAMDTFPVAEVRQRIVSEAQQARRVLSQNINHSIDNVFSAKLLQLYSVFSSAIISQVPLPIDPTNLTFLDMVQSNPALNTANADFNATPVLPSSNEINSNCNVPDRPKLVPLSYGKSTETSVDLNSTSIKEKSVSDAEYSPKALKVELSDESESSQCKPSPSSLPPRKRYLSEFVTETSSCPPLPATVFVQDESINNFAQENRKENLITIKRKCLVDDCSLLFQSKSDMFAHMANVHKVLQFRCNVIDCTQSFKNQQLLTAHLKSIHATMPSFGCPKCPKKFSKYELMSHHIYSEHALGQFKCAIESCAFSATVRCLVSRHFEKTHRSYTCKVAGCGRTFTYTGHLRTHERTHLGMKPFGCKWHGCDYMSENKSHILSHIRIKHFRLPTTKKRQEELGIIDKRDPKQYLSVDDEMVARAREVISGKK